MGFQFTILLLLIFCTDSIDSASRCLSYPDPKNGYITCDSLFHLFCSPECHPGYRFATKPAVVYMCGPVTGEWFTYPVGSALPWPDCIPDDRSDSSIHQELAKKREEITNYIKDSHTGIPTAYSQARRIDPEERYHHLYDYIERAQKAYEYREAIEKETEKLKHENVATKENIITRTQNYHYKTRGGSYQLPSTPTKIPLSYTKNIVARKDSVSPKHGHSLTEDNSPDKSLVVQNALIQKSNSSLGYDKRLPITPYRNWNDGVSSQQSFIKEQLRGKTSSPNFQVTGNFDGQQRTALPTKSITKTIPYKKDSNFVLKMLNNEEFKDLHYLDEHIRLNRDAHVSIKKKYTQSVSNDVRVGTNVSDKHRQMTSSKVVPKNDLGDISLAKANKEFPENENLSNHIVPIVMSRNSLVNSVASLLKKQEIMNRNIKRNQSILNLQDKDKYEKQQKESLNDQNNRFSSEKNQDLIKAQLNQNREIYVSNSTNNMKNLYNSWFEKHGNSLNSYSNEFRKKNISLQTKMLPWKHMSQVTVKNVGNVSTIKSREQHNETRIQEGTESEKNGRVKEHIFYFPVKKDTLFEILNETSLISKP